MTMQDDAVLRCEDVESIMPPLFKVDQQVEYWSATYNRWMDAKVTEVDYINGILHYNLDVKRHAQAKNIRAKDRTRLEELALVADTSADVTGAAFRGGDEAGFDMFEVTATSEHMERYSVGETVEYWSDTHQMWMEAEVVAAKPDRNVYDLSVKANAKAKKIRRRAVKAPPPLEQEAAAVEVSRGGDEHPGAPAPAVSSQREPMTQPHHLAQPLQLQQQVGPSVGSGLVGASLAAPLTAPRENSRIGGVSAEATPAPSLVPTALQSPSISMAPPAVSYTHVVQQHQTQHGEQRATHSAAGARPVAQVVAPISGVRGPSPLSGRGRATAHVEPAVGQSAAVQLPAGALSGAPLPVGASVIQVTVSSPKKVRSVEGSPMSVQGGAATPPHRGPHGQQQPVLLARPGVAGTQALGARGGASLVQHGGYPAAVAKTGPVAARPLAGALGRAAQGLEVAELHLGAEPIFDPLRPALRAQLLEKLRIPAATARVAAMEGFRGGLNEGVWYVSSPGRDELVLKLVRCKRLAANIPTEAENFMKLYREHPTAYRDPTLALPFKIFGCIGRGGMKMHDLIVMQRVRGERLAEWMAKKWYKSQAEEMYQLFERLGASLAEYHARYGGAQHGDFQPSNIFYDETADALYFIDMGGMGVPTVENDVEHFVKSLMLLSQSYNSSAAIEGEHYFKRGYERACGRR